MGGGVVLGRRNCMERDIEVYAAYQWLDGVSFVEARC